MRGFFSVDYEPVESVDPGGSVSFHAFNARWRWDAETQEDKPEDGGHALAGPFEVRGAKAGQTLLVRIDEVTPRDWGENWGDGQRFEWRRDGDVWRMGAHSVPYAPFLGVVGMPPPEPDNEHDPDAVAVWDAERRLQVGYVPATFAPELRGDEQAVALWELRDDDGRRAGLRVLIAPPDAWIQEPRA